MVSARAKRPGTFTPTDLVERTIHRRAVEAVIWGMPVVCFDLMYRSMVRVTKGVFNQVLYWSRLPEPRSPTANPEAISLLPFINTKDVGAVVLEIPAAHEGAINGTVLDCWQAPLGDVGPAGADKGKGGKYLILPPGHDLAVPDGYLAMPSSTYQGYGLLRSSLWSAEEPDVTRAVAHGRRIALYPLAQAAHPPQTIFVDAIDVVFDSSIPYDVRFFESLDRMVQSEPWLERDRAMIGQLKSIGIEKGKPFKPDAKTRRILTAAAIEAQALLEVRSDTNSPSFYEGEQWTNLKAFMPRPAATDQFYLVSIRDNEGRPLNGGGSYRLHVPENAPVKQSWSATGYDRLTHDFIRNVLRASRSSQSPGLQKNPDGSVDIYFGPKPPSGKQSNWVPTSADGDFEVVFRLYGPEPPLFDKTWKLPDIEKTN